MQSQKSQTNKSKLKIFVWTLFDFANTSYSIVVVTFLYAVYFKETVAEGKSIGDFYWSLGTSISMLITAIISPILGAISDYSAGKKRFLLFFTLLCIFCTANLFWVGSGNVLFGLALFILASVGFEAGLVFYDAFLPGLTKPKNYGRVSGYGFAMGYFGSLAILGICFPFIQDGMLKETFPIAGLFFLVFALPLFIVLKDDRSRQESKSYKEYAKIGFLRVTDTIKHLRSYKNLSFFLLSFFFYIEGVNTVIFFSGNYAKSTLKFTNLELIIFFIIVQSTAIFGSVLFGILSDSIGQKKSIKISLYIWLFTMGFAYITSGNNFITESLIETMNISFKDLAQGSFYVVGLLAGSVMGATQSTSRSLMSQLIPTNKKTEFFGFYSFFGKSSAILGPLTFGVVSYLTGNQRMSIISIGIFFIIGLIFLRFVKDPSTEG